ncbi:hypothetical protein GA0116948_1019 [Chitinophaga costaii]|uniref:Enoyl reductase (ER) domain-containing protein n=1 Tax=Chitinophaga costaii TaxID=1335309 RepID=A0A1C3YNY3_9BACT|nr:NADP-dependent oxidoreductase [Chitinophaga costaii]PUZ30024.1 NADP-dependent oxidoreductase [Chitinophaga costaii]SCB71773.1 hypothetical protein GA0116948_1019 [Chitinophaga costaii]
MKSKLIRLAAKPQGLPQANDFSIAETTLPPLTEGQLALQALYISVDPYLRAAMAGGHPPNIHPGDVMISRGLAAVTATAHKDFKPGDIVMGYMEWRDRQVCSANGLEILDPQNLPLSTYLSVLGSTGLSAYFFLQTIGFPKPGQTMVVSGAAGAVGSIAGQIGKIYGSKVIGIVGSDEKAAFITSLGMDAAINYKTTPNIAAALGQLCPEGIDLYFDNVGGFISDAVFAHMNNYGRVVVSGSIANYNDQEVAMGPRLLPIIMAKKLLLQGFLIGDYKDRFKEGREQLRQWINEDKIHYRETIIKGFEQLPTAFIGLFSGQNEGKMLVEI